MADPKKILLVTRPIAPPWDEASKNFAYYLAKNTPDFDFFLLTNGFIKDLPKNIRQNPIYTSNHLSWLQRARLLKIIRMRKDADIIHFMLTPAKLNAFGFKTFIRHKKTRTIQTVATLREDLFSDADFKSILFADLIITYSDHAKNKLNSIGFQNVKRVYPGIDLEYYSPRPKDVEAMRQLGIGADDFVVTYPGEYVRLGATDDIIKMITDNASLLREKKIKILLACRLKNDPEAIRKKDEVLETLEKHNALDLAVFVDIFPDMAALYNLSDIIIFPVRNMRGKFDVPLAAIEPMACEKPVVISDLPILAEFANKENSVTIGQGRPDQLIAAILDLYANPEKRVAIGKNGRKFTEENFDIKNISKIYSEIYRLL